MPTVQKIMPYRCITRQKRKTAAYARVSESTEMLMHSLSTQVDHYTKFIKSNLDWEFAGVYVDAGITGTSIKVRENFKRMIADCEAGKIELILTKSISRFARDTVDCLSTIRHLKELGIEIRFEREHISTLTSEGEFLITLLASFAQAESESISTNIKWAIRNKFKEGIPNGHKAPFGYRWDGEMFRIIPEEGAIVKEIFEMFLSGKSGYAITKILKGRGVIGQKGIPIDESTIRDMLSNISYTGTMMLQKYFFTDGKIRKDNHGELPRYLVEGMFEPLVSEMDFEAAQQIKKERAEKAANRNQKKHAFTGIIKCGNCGCGISRRNAGKHKKWGCNNRERKGSDFCDLKKVNETELIDAAKAALGVSTFDESYFREKVDKVIVNGDSIVFLFKDGKEKKVLRQYGKYNAHSGYSKKIFCGNCGSICRRDTWRNSKTHHAWTCTNTECKCGLKPVPEEIIREIIEKALETANPEQDFAQQVKKAFLFGDHIEFILKDGRVTTWSRE